MNMRLTQLANIIVEQALKAVLYEVSATPKPGLVDRNNNGAHKDMNFYTFIDSSVRLSVYFRKIADTVLNLYDQQEDSKYLRADLVFNEIKSLGIDAEKEMFQVTDHVNTHKGAIFSLGLMVSSVMEFCCVHLKNQELIQKKQTYEQIIVDELRTRISAYIVPELKDHFDRMKAPHTYGEKQFLKYGLTGARGEAASGYETIFKIGLPAFEQALYEGMSLNDAMIQALITLMCSVEDSNVIGRHNPEVLLESQDRARQILLIGGMKSAEGKQAVLAYDKWCIEKNISHGGCADLLAGTLMVWFVKTNLI